MAYTFAGQALTDRETLVVDAILGALPELTGTDKQIAWAADIRRNMAVYAVATDFGTAIANRPDTPAFAAQMAAMVGKSKLMVAEAHRWIEAQMRVKNGRAPNMQDIANGKAPL